MSSEEDTRYKIQRLIEDAQPDPSYYDLNDNGQDSFVLANSHPSILTSQSSAEADIFYDLDDYSPDENSDSDVEDNSYSKIFYEDDTGSNSSKTFRIICQRAGEDGEDKDKSTSSSKVRSYNAVVSRRRLDLTKYDLGGELKMGKSIPIQKLSKGVIRTLSPSKYPKMNTSELSPKHFTLKRSKPSINYARPKRNSRVKIPTSWAGVSKKMNSKSFLDVSTAKISNHSTSNQFKQLELTNLTYPDTNTQSELKRNKSKEALDTSSSEHLISDFDQAKISLAQDIKRLASKILDHMPSRKDSRHLSSKSYVQMHSRKDLTRLSLKSFDQVPACQSKNLSHPRESREKFVRPFISDKFEASEASGEPVSIDSEHKLEPLAQPQTTRINLDVSDIFNKYKNEIRFNFAQALIHAQTCHRIHKNRLRSTAASSEGKETLNFASLAAARRNYRRNFQVFTEMSITNTTVSGSPVHLWWCYFVVGCTVLTFVLIILLNFTNLLKSRKTK